MLGKVQLMASNKKTLAAVEGFPSRPPNALPAYQRIQSVIRKRIDKWGVSEVDVRSYLRGRVAGYKVPKKVEFARELPREDSGKIFKRKLREAYWEGRGRRIN